MKKYGIPAGKVKYVRDSRSPVPKNEKVSKVMSANRAKNTGPEITVRRYLSDRKIKGYRLHPTNIEGRPDIVFGKRKVAIFVNGCYWHACPYCKKELPKTNRGFWKKKFVNNKIRDERNTKILRRLGWKVFVLWECRLTKKESNVLQRLAESLK